jgi:hypothetical protein
LPEDDCAALVRGNYHEYGRARGGLESGPVTVFVATPGKKGQSQREYCNRKGGC